MPTYMIEPAQAQTAVTELRQSNQKIQQIITALETDSGSALLEWEGAVKVTYAEQKQKWDAACAAMATALNTAGGVLDGIIGSYGNAERIGEAMWHG